MITSEQADTIIALLTAIRDELQAPRRERERLQALAQQSEAERAATAAALAAADASARAARGGTTVVGGAGMALRVGPATGGG